MNAEDSMSRVNVFFFVLAFSSASMQRTTESSVNPHNTVNNATEEMCKKMMENHHQTTTQKVAEELYKEAFTLNFNGEWQKAKNASDCAAHLLGSDHWNVEAKDLIR
jgi:hypothetical protein